MDIFDYKRKNAFLNAFDCKRKNTYFGNKGINRAIISIIDDDAQLMCNDTYLGLTSWINAQGIPMAFACPVDTINTTAHYWINQLKALEAAGNEVICHGTTSTGCEDLYVAGTLDTETARAKAWLDTNGFTCRGYVYPSGNSRTNWQNVASTIGEYFDYAYNVNVSDAYAHTPNDLAITSGRWCTLPINDMMNIPRMEIKEGMWAKSWWKAIIDNCIAEKGYLTFFMHSWVSGFPLQDFKDVITYCKNAGCEFLTPSDAIAKINLYS